MSKVTTVASTGATNIQADQNADLNLTVYYKDANGSAISLVGYTAKMQIRTGYSEPDSILTLTGGSGLTLGGSAGTVAIAVTAAQNLTLTGSRTYVYDLVITSPANVATRLLFGDYYVDPGVTR